MAIAFLKNIPLLFKTYFQKAFSQKTVRLGALSWDREKWQKIVRLAAEPWELADLYHKNRLFLITAFNVFVSVLGEFSA